MKVKFGNVRQRKHRKLNNEENDSSHVQISSVVVSKSCVGWKNIGIDMYTYIHILAR